MFYIIITILISASLFVFDNSTKNVLGVYQNSENMVTTSRSSSDDFGVRIEFVSDEVATIDNPSYIKTSSAITSNISKARKDILEDADTHIIVNDTVTINTLSTSTISNSLSNTTTPIITKSTSNTIKATSTKVSTATNTTIYSSSTVKPTTSSVYDKGCVGYIGIIQNNTANDASSKFDTYRKNSNLVKGSRILDYLANYKLRLIMESAIFSHKIEGKLLSAQYTLCGISGQVGENLAIFNYVPTGDEVINSWKDSASHNKILLESWVKRYGIACGTSDKTIYNIKNPTICVLSVAN